MITDNQPSTQLSHNTDQTFKLNLLSEIKKIIIGNIESFELKKYK